MNKKTATEQFAYDRIPYVSYPFKRTHPYHLHAVAGLFHLEAPDVETARILELGCASGGNIIPMACNIPGSRITGIDLSQDQVNAGNETIRALQLKNISIHHMSIDEITGDFGIFDYIICHGVYSWVPDRTSNNILKICKQNLSPNGVALVSYNVLPGWNNVQSLREMMLYHTKDINDPWKKVEQARILLNFLSENLEKNSPYRQLIETEIELLSTRNNEYLLHDHLGEINKPVYFHQFIARAKQHGLSYLADTPVAMMYPYNLSEQAAAKLEEIKDIIKTCQYMDFLRNQRFKSTLLTHTETVESQVKRTININDIEKFHLSCPNTFDLSLHDSADDQITVRLKDEELSITSKGPVPKEAFLILFSQHGKPVSYQSLVSQIMGKTAISDRNTIRHVLNVQLNLVRLVLAGIINVHTYQPRFNISPCDKPLASDYTRYKAAMGHEVVNQLHDLVNIDLFQRLMLLYMDGNHSNPEIIEFLCDHVKKGELQLLSDNKIPVNDKAEIKNWCTKEYNKNIDYFTRSALLLDA